MQGRSALLRFLAVPLRHKLIAAAITLATASGCVFLSQHRPDPDEGTALLSFNAAAASQIILSHAAPGQAGPSQTGPSQSGSGWSQTGQQAPAVAFAQSILSDGVVAALAGRIDPGPGPGQSNEQTAEYFRSQLELTQPTPETLRVHYRNSDQKLAAAAANAVAEMLGGWIPPFIPPIAQPAIQAPAPTSGETAQKAIPIPPPAPAPAKRRGHTASQTAAQEVVRLQVQLASTDRRVARLTASGSSSQRRPQQSGSKNDAQDTQRLLATPPTMRIVEDGPDDAAVPDIDRVRAERERLAQRLEAAQKRAVTEAAEGAPQADGTSAAAVPNNPPSTPQVSTAPPVVVAPPSATPPSQVLASPFILRQRAGEGGFNISKHGAIWLGAALGLLFGLVYAVLMVRRYRPVEDADMLRRALSAGVAYLGSVSRGSVSRGVTSSTATSTAARTDA